MGSLGHYSSGQCAGYSPAGNNPQAVGTLQMPAFFIYVCVLCKNDFGRAPKLSRHLIPFLFAWLFWMGYHWGQTGNVHWFNNTQHLLVQGVQWLLWIQGFVYLWQIALRIRIHKERLGAKQGWLNGFSLILLLANILSIARAAGNTLNLPNVGLINVYLVLLSLVFICFLVIKEMQMVSALQWVHYPAPIIQTPTPASSKLQALTAWMENHRFYTQPNLTIQTLANEMGLSKAELSALINQELCIHFFDFVNGYRIRMAQQELRRTDALRPSIKEICYMVGFNSKSSFNTAFKKYTGTTPSAYREQFSR